MPELKNIFRNLRSPRGTLVIRRVIQVLSFAAVLGLLIWSQRVFYLKTRGSAAEFLINLPIRLDPLVMLTQMIANRVLFPLGLLSLITIAATLVLGRVWCGWFCPLGSIQDWLPGRKDQTKLKPPPDFWRRFKYGLLVIIITAALFSNLSLLIFDPLTIIYRTVTAAFLPGLDQIVTMLEQAFLRIPFLQSVVIEFDSLIRPVILPSFPDQFRAGVLYGGVLIGILLLNFWVPRFYCRYICPLGGLLSWLAKKSWFRVRIQNNCTQCQACVSVCPTGALQVHNGVVVDAAECTMCMICPTTCPGADLEIKPGSLKAEKFAYDPDRRLVLLTLGASALGAGVLQAGVNRQRTYPHLIRPPGVMDETLLQTCIRCGECSEVCPTNAIQPALMEAGVEGLWTPVLVPRIGYCDYSCQACGQVCPVGAIPALSLSEKRAQIIGKAYLDTDRCLAWSDLEDCVVCEEMCPVPEKAIWLEENQVEDRQGNQRLILQPVVDRESCIGCGICEHKCPVSGTAAIRVYTPGLDCFDGDPI